MCACTPQALNHLSFLSLSLLLPPSPHPSFPELANQIQYSILQDIQQGESWENGKPPLFRPQLNWEQTSVNSHLYLEVKTCLVSDVTLVLPSYHHTLYLTVVPVGRLLSFCTIKHTHTHTRWQYTGDLLLINPPPSPFLPPATCLDDACVVCSLVQTKGPGL